MRADRQPDRQTYIQRDMLVTVLRSPTEGGLKCASQTPPGTPEWRTRLALAPAVAQDSTQPGCYRARHYTPAIILHTSPFQLSSDQMRWDRMGREETSDVNAPLVQLWRHTASQGRYKLMHRSIGPNGRYRPHSIRQLTLTLLTRTDRRSLALNHNLSFFLHRNYVFSNCKQIADFAPSTAFWWT